MNHRRRMSSHGIMQPNPALCESHLATPRHVLGHEFGQGATCLVCTRGCPGFQLHYWRKQCINCGCGIPDHDIDFTNLKPYFVTVGRITERQVKGQTFKPQLNLVLVRPLRSREEESRFIFGYQDDYFGENDFQNKYSDKFSDRRRNLYQQFPLHDIDHTYCHTMTQEEINKYNKFLF